LIVLARQIARAGLEWFNVARPLALEDLRGKLVILDFWTYCCINCMQVLPTLRRVEEAFPEEVVVIGVHSPKFAAERSSHNLREAIARYGIEHPVVQDPDMSIWRDYAVRAWPTLVFVGPDGNVIGQAPGEPDAERLFEAVSDIVAQGKAKGEINASHLPLLARDEPPGRLSYPGKIKPVPGAKDERSWALADGGHHQIVLLDDAGHELRRFGEGRAGLKDGGAEDARFNSPQGLVCREDAIFVADAFNHAIRRIDLPSGEVTTLAGQGRRGPVLAREWDAREAVLASVWDLELAGDRLFFANAGSHQLGELDLGTHTVRPLAGNGGEDIVDGPALDALLAQPSGLALSPSGDALVFADSETSSVRRLTLDGGSCVETLVGAGLFDFDHRNGPLPEARFQHPLGVAWLDPAQILVADSYNAALRVIDLEAREVRDFDGGDFVCQDPVCLPLGEPAGVIADGPDRVLVADTNNHRVLEYTLSAKTYRSWAV
jgi:thiol-disulfide isomerase/thioredoxin